MAAPLPLSSQQGFEVRIKALEKQFSSLVSIEESLYEQLEKLKAEVSRVRV